MLLAIVACAAPVLLVSQSVPNTFGNGTVANADLVNGNFADIDGRLSDGLYPERFIRQQHGPGNIEGSFDPVADRVLTFTKKRADTVMKLTYMDEIRSHNGYCTIEFTVNNASCNPVVNFTLYSANTGDNPHISRTLEGYCEDLGAGDHTFRVKSTGSTCYFNYEANLGAGVFPLWMMEAEEVVRLPSP